MPLPAESIAQEAAAPHRPSQVRYRAGNTAIKRYFLELYDFWHSVPAWLDTDPLAEVRAYATGHRSARTACLTAPQRGAEKH